MQKSTWGEGVAAVFGRREEFLSWYLLKISSSQGFANICGHLLRKVNEIVAFPPQLCQSWGQRERQFSLILVEGIKRVKNFLVLSKAGILNI